MPSRRSYLAGLSALLAGCTAPASQTATPPDTDDRSPTPSTSEPSRTTDETTDQPGTCCYHRITMRAREATPGDVADAWTIPFADLSARQRAVVDGSLGGETTVENWRGPPLDAGSYLESDGTYYRVDETVVDERTVTTYRFELRVPAEREPEGKPIRYADLTPSERRVVDEGLDGWQPGDSGFLAAYGWVFESESAGENCRFLDGESHFVEYEGEVVSIYHDDTGQAAVTTYRYAFPEVASDRAAFTDLVVRERVGVVSDAGFDAGATAVAEDLFGSGHYRSDNPAGEVAETVAYWCYEFVAPFGTRRDAFVRYEDSLYAVEIEETMA